MIGLVVTNGGCVIVLLAKCHPIRGNWDGEVGKCWNPNIYNDIIWVQVGNKSSLFWDFFDAEICSRLLYILRLDLFTSSNRSFVESQNPISVQNGNTRPDGLGIAVFFLLLVGCSATDLKTGQQRVVQRGPLFPQVIWSMT